VAGRIGVAAVLSVIVAVSIGLPASWRAWDSYRHAAQGQVQLRISATPGVQVRLHRTGATLESAAPVPVDPAGAWLSAANYFVTAGTASKPLFYPVPLMGFLRGPDQGGTFAVSVRPVADSPPRDDDDEPFVVVPGGQFLLGDRLNPGEAHFVWTGTFFIGSFEVTNREFRRFVSAPDGYDDARNWTVEGWRWRTGSRSQATAYLTPRDPDYERFGADELPVVLVTWFEASAYARWLTRTRGEGRWLFRLPTEAEWEKAARGPDSFDYGLGQELSDREAPLYNWKKNPEASVTLVGATVSRRAYRPNRYGVYHASGNAAEWTLSVHRPYNVDRPYRDDERNAGDTPGMRVTRGGSWYSANIVRLRLSYREEFQPNLSSNDLGFRVAAVRLPVR